jgi:1,2-diacylglycerol 3-alpha-glucosyltransferase
MNEVPHPARPVTRESRFPENPSEVICWEVVNVSHYHSARMTAFARRVQTPPVFLELTDKDIFQLLEHPGWVNEAYGRQTLFPGRPFRQLSSRGIRKNLRECISRLRPSMLCINGWGMRGSIEALQECLRLGIPTVLMSDTSAMDRPRTEWRERIKRRVVRLCSAAMVAGKPQGEYALALGIPRERIFVGCNVVDNDHFWLGARAARGNDQDIRRRLDLPDLYFLACARFEGQKNLFRLLEAFGAYKTAVGKAAWKLVVLGDGMLKDQLFSACSQLGLCGDVLFPGFKGYDELPIYYGLAGTFVHASTREPWGLVVNEAMAAGLPVLVSERCGCVPDLVREGRNGWKFDPLNVEALAKLMTRVAQLSANERLSIGRASREIIANWTLETFADSLGRAIAAAKGAPRPVLAPLDRALLCLLTLR